MCNYKSFLVRITSERFVSWILCKTQDNKQDQQTRPYRLLNTGSTFIIRSYWCINTYTENCDVPLYWPLRKLEFEFRQLAQRFIFCLARSRVRSQFSSAIIINRTTPQIFATCLVITCIIISFLSRRYLSTNIFSPQIYEPAVWLSGFAIFETRRYYRCAPSKITQRYLSPIRQRWSPYRFLNSQWHLTPRQTRFAQGFC